MKRSLAIALICMLTIGLGIGLSSYAKSEAVSESKTEQSSEFVVNALDWAVDNGYGTEAEAQNILQSKIYERTLQKFISTGSPSVVIDEAAAVAVEQGWFKDKKTAKAHCKKQLERARSDNKLWNYAYSILGL